MNPKPGIPDITCRAGALRGYVWDHLHETPYVYLRMRLHHPLWGDLFGSLHDGLWAIIRRDLQERAIKGQQ